jgi:autotransporter-associated beta strand protein
MLRPSLSISLRACVAAAAVVVVMSGSSARAVSYTWASLSTGGDWTTAANWNPNTGYPGLTLTGTDVALFNQDITGNQSVNLDASVGIQNLFLGDTAQTSGTFNTIAISTTNGSALTFNSAAGLSVVSLVGGVDAATENVIAPNINLTSGTLEFRNNLTSGGGANGRFNLALLGNVTSGTTGGHILRFTYAGNSTGALSTDFRGDITNGPGTVSIFFRKDNSTTGTRQLKLSGTGNTFSGVIDFRGGINSILESSPASGTNGALGTGRIDLGISGSTATLNLGGSPSTVTEVNGINIPGTGARRIAVIGAGNRILSGTVNQATSGGLTLACSDAGNLTFSNVISGNGPITISSTGAGKVIFSGNNTHTGTTTVTAGRFQLDGSLNSSSILSVAAAGWLGGSGTANGAVTLSGGTLSPGSTSPGVLSLGSLTLTATSTALFDLLAAGTRGTDYDGVSILNAGGLTYGGTMSLAFGGSVLPDNTTFNVFSFTGSPSGSFGQVSSTGFYAGTWTNNLDGTYSLAKDAQTLTFAQATGIVTIVPEPTTTVAIVAAIGLAAVCRRPRVWAAYAARVGGGDCS